MEEKLNNVTVWENIYKNALFNGNGNKRHHNVV